MPTLLFTVAPSGVAQIHDLLTCLGKFDEDVSLEATPQFVRTIDACNTSAVLTLIQSYEYQV
jgi:hypothetical protein